MRAENILSGFSGFVRAYCTLVNKLMALSGQALMAKIAHAALISAEDLLA
jgi:hypothetical protein